MRRNASPRTCAQGSSSCARHSGTVDFPDAMTPVMR